MQLHYNNLERGFLVDLWDRLSSWQPGEPMPASALLRQGNTRRVFLVRRPEFVPMVVKCWFRSHGSLRLKTPADLHSGDNEARFTRLAHERGVAPYEPMAFAERGWGRGRQLLLVLPFLENRQTLEGVLEDPATSPELARQLLRRFGASLARIHQAGLIHNDYKLDNVLLEPERSLSEAALEVIDWGKAYEADTGDQRQHLAEVIYALDCLSRGRLVVQEVQASFCDGYAQETPWFARDRQRLEATIEQELVAKQRQSNRRVWRNSLRKSRRLTIGKQDGYRYYLFDGAEREALFAAVREEPDAELAICRWNASQLWQAANVLQAVGEDDGGVRGLAIRRSLFGQGEAWLAYRPGAEPLQPQELLARAQAYL